MNTLFGRAPDTVSTAAAGAAGIDRRRGLHASRSTFRGAAGLLVLVLAGAFAIPAHAANPSADFRLAFDCNAAQLPSQQDVARLFGTHNFGQTYRAREQLMRNVRRDCQRGVRQVVVQAAESLAPAPTIELATAR